MTGGNLELSGVDEAALIQAGLVDASTDAIISKALNGTILSWNPAAEQLFGYTASEIIGKSIRLLIPEELQGEEDEIVSRIKSGEVVSTFETIRLHKDGHAVPLAVTISPIRAPDGSIIGASKIARDLSAEVQRRQNLRLAEDRFRMLADNIDQLAWITDPSGWIEWYNKRWYDFTGTDLEAMQGWGWERVHHPDHIERVTALWKKALSEGVGWEDTFPLRGADGEYRWFLSRARPVRDERGQIKGWFGTNTDISERLDYERRIQLLLGESNHRAKNMLAMIQALVHRTATNEPEVIRRLEHRIAALGANHDLLIKSEWSGAMIRDVVVSQLVYVEDVRETRITIAGPDLMLNPSAAETIGLAIHELVTNAAKYGALSNDHGRVDIEWAIVPGPADEDRFRINWVETGGPLVAEPTATGFGTMLIRRNPEISLGATVSADYAPEGLRWSVDAPLSRMIARIAE